MDRILIIMKKNNGTRESSAPLLGLFSIIFKHVYWYIFSIGSDHTSLSYVHLCMNIYIHKCMFVECSLERTFIIKSY